VITMKVKSLVNRHYRQIVDEAAERVQRVSRPPEGWVRTVRKAIHMSGAQLARRIDGTRALVAQVEKNELSGTVSIRSLRNVAEAMGCRFVYAIVPNDVTTEALIAKRAKEKAQEIVAYAGKHMALEAQALGKKQTKLEIERLQKQFVAELPSDLWDNK
jgi:predicted DNA-binding mobile mystery protein A